MCVHGESIAVTVLSESFDGVNIGDASLIWEATLPELPVNGDSEIFVNITGIDFVNHDGSFSSIQYSVKVFDPEAPGIKHVVCWY